MGTIVERSGPLKIGSMPTRLRYLFLCATIFGASIIIMSISNISEIVLNHDIMFMPKDQIEFEALNNTFDKRFTIKTEGCSIPYLEAYNIDITEFVKYPTMKEMCPNSTLSYLDNNRTHIWVKEENKINYNVSKEDKVTCCYQSFYRPVTIKDITSLNNDDRVEYNKCINFNKSIEAKDEFVRVICTNGNIEIYKQYYIFAHEKLYSSDSTSTPSNQSAFNVLVMGIDAVSRLNFRRTMPKTYNFFKDMGAIELLGYNKVGDNTFPNLVPMLMGISEQELKRTCTPNKRSTFDNCPFIWEWYKEVGYYTALGEDSSRLGTFNYFKRGFLRNPTDYYLHTFINEAENNVGVVEDFNSYLCMNDRYFYEILLDYISNLTFILDSKNIFGFFWEISMSHDYLNYPMLIDDNYVRFFKNLLERAYLDNTIIFLVSDHGIRWGDIRSTKQGRLEERLPFVYIMTPQRFQKEYTFAFENLKNNAKRLTTPFDMHATLFDLVNTKEIENENINLRLNQYYTQKRGISLFLPIPTNRTCLTANIDDHWCTCHRSRSIAKNSTETMEVAGELIRKINLLVREYKQCAQLKLTEILEISEMDVGSADNNEKGWREYMIVIRTSPGDGLFEATLRRYSLEWTLQGTVSRLNLYGEQSRCVHNYQLKLYCYCL